MIQARQKPPEVALAADLMADKLWALLESKLAGFSPSGQCPPSVQQEEIEPIYVKPDHVEVDGQEYDRLTHPKLFVVIDRLVDDPAARGLSLRKLQAATGVSKSWCGIAKNYWKTL